MDRDADAPAAATRTHRFPQRRVLVVDDDPTFALLAAETLEQCAFKVLVAASAQQARSAFASFAPDIVLLDVGLPDGSGFDVCRFIRSAAKNADVPVVLVTGHDDTTSIEAAYESGATDFLHKPVLWPTLAHKVDFMLRALDARRGLTRSERKNRALLAALPDASFIVNRDGTIAEHLSGSDTVSEQPLVGRTLEEAFPVGLARAAREALNPESSRQRASHEYAVTQADRQRWYEARLRPQPDGTLLIVTCDTTERRKAKERIEYLAYNDVLTRLPNRQQLLLETRAALRDGERAGRISAVLHIDLDRFKRVNDNLGHAVGNALLQSVAGCLEQLLRPQPSEPGTPVARLVARLGGDEFVVLVSQVQDERQVIDVAERIVRLLGEPFACAGHQLVVTPSIGIALAPRDTNDVEDLLVKAEMAMYRAKEQGRNGYAFFGQSLALRSLGRLALETDMRRAFEERAFYLCYQPKLDLATDTVAGVEALLRWNHPERGPVSPEQFIPLAEETGLIVPLGEWVLREVCEQLQRWRALGIANLTAAVNVSVQQFLRRDFNATVVKALQDAQVPPDRLELEITESLLMRNTTQIAASMQHFRTLGVTLSIDDFGTGYSSLGYLRELPVSALKIDRSFVGDLGQREDAATICAAIIALARELKLKVVAEGVETLEQLAFLEQHRCDQAQGFLISRPVPARELEELLLQDGARAAATPRLRNGQYRHGRRQGAR